MSRRLSLLLLALSACTAERGSVEDLYRAGYQALQRGDLGGARLRAEEGLRRAQQQPQWKWPFQVLDAEVFLSQRRSAEAVAALDTGLASPGGADAVRARAFMTRGFARCLLADVAEKFRFAESDLDKAAGMAEHLGSAELTGEVALRRGSCLLLQGRVDLSEMRFREALAVARRETLPFLEASATGSLGYLRMRMSRYDEATEWLRNSLDLATSLKADSLLLKTLGNLGSCYDRLGDQERALTALRRAEALARDRGFGGDRLVALTHIGNALYHRNDHAGAAEHYKRALTLAGALGDRRAAARLLSNLGVVALDQGRHDEAESQVRESLRMKGELGDERERLRDVLTLGRIAGARGNVAKAESLYGEVISSSQTESEWRWAARAALARLHAEANRLTEAEAEFRRAFALMEESRGRLREAENRISFFASLRRFYDDYVEFRIREGRSLEALHVADGSRARLLRERLSNTEPESTRGVEDLRRLGRETSAILLSYWTAPTRSFLWVVTPKGVELRLLPGDAELRRLVDAYQSLILRSRDPLAEGSREGQRLWETLVGQAAGAIPPGSRVIVLPDGPLHQLNFETLVVPSPHPHYWIEDVTVATAPSLHLMDTNRSRRHSNDRTLLAIGDPVSPNDEFPRLAHAAREMARVTELFEPAKTKVYSGPDAEPAAYQKANPDRFAFIHFAAHVTANREVPLDSAVVLSPRDEGYKLYAREIITIHLRADLVTLSACRSAGSRAYAGEGLVGLAWAFLSSGAANVVGGLWNVEDASTAELMEHLYRGLQEGLDPAIALRRAKLRLLHSETAYRKPFYWAPFVVYTRRPR